MMSKALAKRQKAVILYATETGKSERYAKMLGELFSYAFDPKVRCTGTAAILDAPSWIFLEVLISLIFHDVIKWLLDKYTFD